jgi:hypothetical protein
MNYDHSSRNWLLKSGIDVKLMIELSSYLNFSMKTIHCNYDWGIKLPNKTWSGIIGKIASKVNISKH